MRHGGHGGHGRGHHRPPHRRMGCCVYVLGMALLLAVVIAAVLVLI